ncbi:MAG: type 4a pilus biogenesis protein PilO [Deltaproteobacteria bacterium]|nr:type 4a pilus biogenesis protein PilO [Deltaproteobacteria bacterium]
MAITLDDIKKMPPRKKALAICLVYFLLGYFYYFFILQSSLEKKGALETKLAELEQQVQTKERIASQKDKYVRELNALKEAFKHALTKLPDRKEIPGLLYSVAMAGKGVGMDFVLFEPTPKKPDAKPHAAAPKQPGQKAPDGKKGDGKGAQDSTDADKFYEEIPVKVVVNGGFHDTALFFDKVAKLPRIVNIEEITMGDRKDVRGRGRVITTSCVIKTYMFMEKKDDQGKKADGKK